MHQAAPAQADFSQLRSMVHGRTGMADMANGPMWCLSAGRVALHAAGQLRVPLEMPKLSAASCRCSDSNTRTYID